MIQAIQSQAQLAQISQAQKPQSAQPLQAAPAVTPPSFQADSLHIQSKRGFDRAEAQQILEALQAKYGQVRKSGFFKNKKISLNEALNRVKDGDKIVFHNKNLRDMRIYIDGYNELLLVDDLQGRKGDHGVAKPELRLPLLFLENQNLEEYRHDDRDRLDPYKAYGQLKRGWRIRVNGQTLKPADLPGHVIRSGWTESKDPGQKIRSDFSALPQSGWKINGQNVSVELAYLAFITDAQNLSLDGVKVQGQSDLDLLLNLIAGRDNGALDADLRQRLTGLKLEQFRSPVNNYYSVYKRLQHNQPLNYGDNTLHNLNEVIVYDALNGSQRPSDLLAPALHSSLLYLTQDRGLSTHSAFTAWQRLKGGESVSYSFNGGPTHEPIRFSASSHAELIQLKNKVVAQRQRDQFRPDLAQAKQIVADRVPQFENTVARNLESTRRAVARAESDIPIQEAKRQTAQQDYNRIRPAFDRAQREYSSAERTFRNAESRYNNDRRNYDWEMSKYQRIERDMERAERRTRQSENNLRQAQQNVRSYQHKARQAEAKAKSDPDNAAKHNQTAQRYRQRAQQAQRTVQSETQNIQRYRREAQRHRRDLDSQRWDVDRARRQMEYSQQNYWEAKGSMDSAKRAFDYQQGQLNDASTRLREAENTLGIHRKTVANGRVIEQLSASLSRELKQLKNGVARLRSYGDYAQQRQALHLAAQKLKDALKDETYQAVHGRDMSRQFVPVHTLLNNMDKPAA